MVCEDTLRIKNLPKELSDAEKEEFLNHFGAIKVRIITSTARNKSVAFAKFDTKETAKNVMLRLHQLNILNSRLCVEYADQDIGCAEPKSHIKIDEDQNKTKYFKMFLNRLNAFNNSVNFFQPPPPHLKYAYPKPNRATINNIAHALASVPKFYTQVLHLMNKMNLPPPFSNVPDPPARQNVTVPSEPKKSSSESEMESDSEQGRQNRELIPVKRKLPQKKMIKRPKFIKPNVAQPITKTPEKPEDVFEKVDLHTPRIELKVTTESLDALHENAIETEAETTQPNTIITSEELNKNRVPLEDLRVLPLFKDYHPGVPTNKIYIKNIAKTVELKDLEYIYKRYEGGENEEGEFNIRLMQEGRMKGQAFVTFKSVDLAKQAVEETNGYMIKDKPLVVVFAKSKS